MITTIAMLEVEVKRWEEVVARWQWLLVTTTVIGGIAIFSTNNPSLETPLIFAYLFMLVVQIMGISGAIDRRNHFRASLQERIQMIYQSQTGQ